MLDASDYRDLWMAENVHKYIGFYNREFYCLDNFSAFKVSCNGHLYNTVEEAYQAQGFIDSDPQTYDLIIHSKSAYEAKKIAHEHMSHRRKDWHDVKVGIMEEIIRAKVGQHPYVRKKLLETGNNLICEDSPEDSFWGIGRDGTGENVMGKIWMKVRSEISESR